MSEEKTITANDRKILNEITPLNFTTSYIEIIFADFYEEEKISDDELREKLRDALIHFMDFKKEDINKTIGKLKNER